MSKIVIPTHYKPYLSLYDTQTAIGMIKRNFEEQLGTALNLKRISAPLFVDPTSGLNDDLNGTERPVSFDIPEIKGDAQIVHSLAKWKRMALYQYGFNVGEGLYTDMNAIRRDEELTNLHSIYVDQWDWEKVITAKDRTLPFLQATVQSIVSAIVRTSEAIKSQFPAVQVTLKEDVTFITTQELLDLYPNLSPKERENAFAKLHGTICIMQIGDLLSSGEKHDGRAPDYDDWALNADIVFWHPILQCAFEVSSMGIRVNPTSLRSQLIKAGCIERAQYPFHKLLLDGTLPLTIGGGIGQSRLCMLLLEKAHIGEVQVSLWDDTTRKLCESSGIPLL